MSPLGSLASKKTLTGPYLGRVSRSFKDLSFNFTTNPITNDIVALKNEEAIKQSVKNLVLTKVGERPFRPDVGSNTTSYLFELSTDISSNTLIEEIERLINQYEPRVELVRIDVTVEEDLNNFDVVIDYNIIGLPAETQTLSFILVRES